MATLEKDLTAREAGKDAADFSLLLACVRALQDDAAAAALRSRVAEGVSWSGLARLSALHGVLPLVYRALLEVAPDLLPDVIRDSFRRTLFGTTAHNQILTKELGRLHEVCAAQGIPLLSLKGPVLAELAYGGYDRRAFADLDVLVRGPDFPAVERLLAADGYRPYNKVAGLRGLRKQLMLWQTRQYPFKKGRDVFNLDVHTGVMPALYYHPVPFDAYWERSVEITAAGVCLRTLAPEDMLLVLCYHGEKNRWESLKYVCDVAELIRARPEMDWDAVVRAAHRMRCGRMLRVALCLSSDILDAPLPPVMRAYAEKDAHAVRLASWLAGRLPGRLTLGRINFGQRMRFHLLLQETTSTRARYLFYAFLRRLSRTILLPNVGDLR